MIPIFLLKNFEKNLIYLKVQYTHKTIFQYNINQLLIQEKSINHNKSVNKNKIFLNFSQKNWSFGIIFLMLLIMG